ncbi:MAG TPA: hypothetical protein VHE30_01465 [Polyangiaceae bacterium]|nr:hypothetical protein [Polyangiaceae bacterium]
MATHHVPPEIRELVRRAVDEIGADKTARVIGVSRQTLNAVLADLPVQNGTTALFERYAAARAPTELGTFPGGASLPEVR